MANPGHARLPHRCLTAPLASDFVRSLAHLEANLDRPDSAADLARLVRMTPQGFSRFFHRQVGCTFVTYLNRWRISLACRKLLESDEPITKIAYQVGFNNLSNFHRRFRQFKDMTPAQYRLKVQTGATPFHQS
ncbi:MAG: helix-turn-helix transcriptional regulator [Phycisphaerales bacterium]|nr:helix-turn-helix transcriptional regulator [Phycisphaerales bacterium]